jgi:hypothetical protein
MTLLHRCPLREVSTRTYLWRHLLGVDTEEGRSCRTLVEQLHRVVRERTLYRGLASRVQFREPSVSLTLDSYLRETPRLLRQETPSLSLSVRHREQHR